MPGNWEGVFVALLLLLPGALLTWGYERTVAPWGRKLADRLLRFFGGSVAFHTLTWPIWTWLGRRYAEWFASGDGVPDAVLLLAPVLYVVLPYMMGVATGAAVKRGGFAARLVAFDTAAPTAWDALFVKPPASPAPAPFVRLRLKNGARFGGWLGENPFTKRVAYMAGVDGERDILLTVVADLAPDGSWPEESDYLAAAQSGRSLLIRWAEIDYLELFEAVQEAQHGGEGQQQQRGWWRGDRQIRRGKRSQVPWIGARQRIRVEEHHD